ncbi:MAG: hypothetical protein ACRDAU_05600 [Clostridium sp.]
MELIKECGIVDDETLEFYSKSRRLRNRLAHRYKRRLLLRESRSISL